MMAALRWLMLAFRWWILDQLEQEIDRLEERTLAVLADLWILEREWN